MNTAEYGNLIQLQDRMLDDIMLQSRGIVTSLKTDVVHHRTTGGKAATLALVRLQQSFRTVVFVLRKRFTFEASAIMRLILEQLAWVSVIHDAEEKEIVRTCPVECIDDFTNANRFAGEVYAVLMDVSHLNRSSLFENIRAHPPNAQPQPERMIISAEYVLNLYVLLGLYGMMSEYINRGTRERFRYLDPQGKRPELNEIFLASCKKMQVRLDGIVDRINDPSPLRLAYCETGVG